MIKSLNYLTICLSIALIIVINANIYSQTASKSYIDGKIYFKLKDNSNLKIELNDKSEQTINNVPFLKSISGKYNLTKLSQPFLFNDDAKLLKTYELNYTNIYSADSIINYLNSLDDIEYAEKAPRHKLLYHPNDSIYNSTAGKYNWKWWLDKVNAEKVWDVTKGSPDVVVGISDNAFWGLHPDLKNQIAGQRDVADRDDDANPPVVNTQQEQYSWSHGTHISGIIAGEQDNDIGITGIAPHCKLYFAKSQPDTGNPEYIDYALNGTSYLAGKKVDVISMSWSTESFSQTEENLMISIYKSGIVLVAAAGNDGTNVKNYPAAYSSYVISVGSINADNKRSSFSQYGTWMDISAPGGYYPSESGFIRGSIGIISTTYNTALSVKSYFPGLHYDIMSGTSMATPVVAGICALMKSVNAGLTPDESRQCLKSTAVSLDSYNTGFAGELGAGYPDAYAAVECALNLASVKDINSINGYINVYPNPASDILNVFYNNFKKDFTISLYDIYGEKIKDLISGVNHSDKMISINISSIPSGIYFITINSDIQSISKKIIIIK